MSTFNPKKAYEKVKILNILNHDAEVTSSIINEQTKQGWILASVFMLKPATKKEHAVICVVLTKRET